MAQEVSIIPKNVPSGRISPHLAAKFGGKAAGDPLYITGNASNRSFQSNPNHPTESIMRSRSLSIENLISRQLMAVDIAETEPNNAESLATQFSLPTSDSVILRGNSTSQNDKDYFAFTASVSGSVSVGVNSSGGAKLEVTTRAGAQILETEPKDGVNSGTFQAVAGTTYLLRLRAPEKSAAPYEVTVTAADTSANPGGSPGSGNPGNGNPGNGNPGGVPGTNVSESEPNDSVNQATPLSLVVDEPRSLTGAATKKDRDFFVVTPSSSGTVSINTGSVGAKVSVENRQGAKLFESEPNDGVTQGTFSVTQGQSFVLRVRGLNPSPTNYSIAISLSASPASTTPASTKPASNTSSSAMRSVPLQWLDASDDGVVSPLDALIVINHLSPEHQSAHDLAFMQFDMNDDSLLSPIDALIVINHLNSRGRGTDDLQAEGEANRQRTVGSDDLIESELHRNRRRGR